MNKLVVLLMSLIFLGCSRLNSQKFNLKEGIYIKQPTQVNIGEPFIIYNFNNGIIDSLFINTSDSIIYRNLKALNDTTIIAKRNTKSDKRYWYSHLVILNRGGQVIKEVPGLKQERIDDYQISNDNRYIVKLTALDTNNTSRRPVLHKFYVFDLNTNRYLFISDLIGADGSDFVLHEGAFSSNNKKVVFVKISGPRINIPGFHKSIDSNKSIENGLYIIHLDKNNLDFINIKALGASWSPVDSNLLLFFNHDSVCLYDVRLEKLIFKYSARNNREITNIHWLADGHEFAIIEYFRRIGMPFDSYEQKAINLFTKEQREFTDFYLRRFNSYRW